MKIIIILCNEAITKESCYYLLTMSRHLGEYQLTSDDVIDMQITTL